MMKIINQGKPNNSSDFNSIKGSTTRGTMVSRPRKRKNIFRDSSIKGPTSMIIEEGEQTNSKRNQVDIVDDQTIEISMNASSYIGFDTTKSQTKMVVFANSQFNKPTLESAEYILEQSQKRVLSISSNIDSSKNIHLMQRHDQEIDSDAQQTPPSHIKQN